MRTINPSSEIGKHGEGPLAGVTQQLLLEAAADAVVIVNADGTILFANTQCQELFGYARTELVGHPVELLVPDRVRDSHPAHRAGYLEKPTTRPMGAGLELTARRKDGTEVPVDIALSSLQTNEGLYISASIRDISDRREAQVTQARLAAIVESSADAIVGKTVEGIVTSWNPAATQLFNWSPDEIIGKEVSVLIPERLRSEAEEILSRVALGERISTYETERLTKDERNIVVALTASPIRSTGGEIVGVSSIYRDITALKSAEAKFQGLLEAAPDAIVGVGKDGLIHLVNAQAEKLFGYTRAEMIDQPVEILVPEAIRDAHPGHRDKYFLNPSTRPMGAGLQLKARRKDGSEFPVDISLSSLETEDGLIVSAAVRDISDRMKEAQERELLETQSRQSRMESIGQLAGGIAHDFNNLLAAIMSYAKLVEDGVRALNDAAPESQRDPMVASDIEQIVRATERAAALTHQLLLFGRKEIVKPEILDLNNVVTGMEDLLRRTISEHIQLTSDLSESLPLIRMDAGHVEQILMNLVVNARDAMPSGGRLSIETTTSQLDDSYAESYGAVPGEYVTLVVSDTGSGMPADVVARAFEPYFSTKPRGEGSGLGLATVYGIVSQVEGHIDIHSDQGSGTTVRVYLPKAKGRAAETEQSNAPHEVAVTKGGTILLVEDEELVREPAARFLSNRGYEVLLAADPEEALRLADSYEGEINLLLTDVVMPGMSGKSLAEKLRQTRPRTAVLFMSGYSQDLITSQGVLDPGVVLLEKPFTAEKLVGLVSQILDHPGAGDHSREEH